MKIVKDDKWKMVTYLGLSLLATISYLCSLSTINLLFVIMGYIWPMSVDTYYRDSNPKKYGKLTFLNLVIRFHGLLDSTIGKYGVWQSRLIYLLSPSLFCLVIYLVFNIGNIIFSILGALLYLLLQEVIFKMNIAYPRTHPESLSEESLNEEIDDFQNHQRDSEKKI